MTSRQIVYLEEPELVGSVVRADNQGLDVANIDVAASDSQSCQSVSLGLRSENMGVVQRSDVRWMSLNSWFAGDNVSLATSTPHSKVGRRMGGVGRRLP